MASICYPHHTPEGQALVDRVGLIEATRDWIEHGYTVRDPDLVEDKLNKDRNLGYIDPGKIPDIEIPGTIPDSTEDMFRKNYVPKSEQKVRVMKTWAQFQKVTGFRKDNPRLIIDKSVYRKADMVLFDNLNKDLVIVNKKVFIKSGNTRAFKEFYPFLDYKNPIKIGKKTYYFLTNKYIYDTTENVRNQTQFDIRYALAAKEGRYGIKVTKRANLSPRLKKSFREYIDKKKQSMEGLPEAISASAIEFRKYLDQLAASNTNYDRPGLREEAINRLMENVELNAPHQVENIRKVLNNLPTVVLANMNLEYIEPEIDMDEEHGFSVLPYDLYNPRNLNRFGNMVGSNVTAKPFEFKLNTNAGIPSSTDYTPYIDAVNEEIFNNTFENVLTPQEKERLKSFKVETATNMKSKGLAVLLKMINAGKLNLAKKFSEDYKSRIKQRKLDVRNKLIEDFGKEDYQDLQEQQQFVINLQYTYEQLLGHNIYDKAFDINLVSEHPITGETVDQSHIINYQVANFLYDMSAHSPLLKTANQVIDKIVDEWEENLDQIDVLPADPKARFALFYNAVISQEGHIAEALKVTSLRGRLYDAIFALVRWVCGRNITTAMDVMNQIMSDIHEAYAGQDAFIAIKEGRFANYTFTNNELRNALHEATITRRRPQVIQGGLHRGYKTVDTMIAEGTPIHAINKRLNEFMGSDLNLKSVTLPEGLNLRKFSIVRLNELRTLPRDIHFNPEAVVYLPHFTTAQVPEYIKEQVSPQNLRTSDWTPVVTVQPINAESIWKTRSEPVTTFVPESKATLLAGMKSKYGFPHYATYMPYKSAAFHYTLGVQGSPVTVEMNAATDKFPEEYYKAFNYHSVGRKNPLGWFGGVISNELPSLPKERLVNYSDFIWQHRHYTRTEEPLVFKKNGREITQEEYDSRYNMEATRAFTKWMADTKKVQVFSVTEVQSDPLQRTGQLKGDKEEIRGTDITPFKSMKSSIENHFDGWLYVFLGSGLSSVLQNNPNITEIRIPTTKYYRSKHPNAPVEYYDKMGSVLKHTMSKDGNWYVVQTSDIAGNIPQNLKTQFDVILKSNISAGVKMQKEYTPDLASDREIANDILQEMAVSKAENFFLQKYFNSDIGKQHFEELKQWIESKFSDEKPASGNAPGGEEITAGGVLVTPQGEEVSEEDTGEPSEIDKLIKASQEKTPPTTSLDMDQLLDDLNDAMKKKDKMRVDFIKNLLDEQQGKQGIVAYNREVLSPYKAFMRLKNLGLINGAGFTQNAIEVERLGKAMGLNLRVGYTGNVMYKGRIANEANINDLATRNDTAYYRDQADLNQSPAALNGALNQLPFTLNLGQEDITVSNEIIRNLVENLSMNTGIKYNFISAEQARDITSRAANPWAGERAFFLGDTVYFVGNSFDSLMAFHEFSHPVVRAIASDNPELFSNLYDTLMDAPEGMNIFNYVKDNYPELGEGTDRFKEEVLVRAISTRANDMRSGVNSTPQFTSWVDKILYHIKQFLRKMFGKIKIENLSPNTTVDQLATMLTGEKFQLNTEKLTDQDIVDYMKEFRSYVEARDSDAEIDPDTGARGTSRLTKNLQELIDKLYIASDAVLLQKAVDNEDFNYVLKMLEDDLGRDRIQMIKSDLRKYRSEVLRKAGEKINDLKNLDNATRELAISMDRLLEVTRDFESELKRTSKVAETLMAKDKLTKQEAEDLKHYMLRAKYIFDITSYWKKFLDGTNEEEGFSKSVSDHLPETPWTTLEDNLRRSFEKIYNYYNPIILAGSKSLIYTTMMPMAKLIEQRYLPRIEAAKKAGDLKSAQKLQEEYNEHALSPKRIENMLKGNHQDANYLNNWVESYFYSADDVVGGFTVWLTKHLSEVDTNTMNRYNSFLKEVQEPLRKLGYNPNNLTQLLNMIAVKDVVGGEDERGDFVEREVWRIKSKHKGWQRDHFKLRHAQTMAHQEGMKTNDMTAYEKASKDLDEWEETWLYREYHKEVYDLDKIFSDSEVGRKAKALRDEIFERLRELDNQIKDEEEYLQTIDERDALWRRYRQLCSLKDAKDEYKTGEDKEIAQKLQEYKEKSRDYYQWTLAPNVFQRKYEQFQRQLIDIKGLSPEDPVTAKQFYHEMNQWKEANMVVAYTPEYYDEVNKVFKEINEILAKAKGKSAVAATLAIKYKDLFDTLASYRDEDGQPVGINMGDSTREKIKSLQEEINTLQKNMNSSLTTKEQELFKKLEFIYDTNGYLNDEQERQYDELVVKRSMPDDSGLNGAEKARLSKLWSDLSNIRQKQATSYYLDVLGVWLKGTKIKQVLDFDKANRGPSGLATTALSNYLNKSPHILRELFKEDEENNPDNPQFKKWFEQNHIEIERWDYEAKKLVKMWERLPMWNITRPKSERHLVHTNVTDHNGNVISIPGKPSMRFYRRDVKGLSAKEHKELRLLSDKEFLSGLSPEERKRKGDLEKIEREGYKTPKIIGQTVDNKGNWLPRGIAEGAPSDQYINREYENLRFGSDRDKDMYNLIEIVKKHYLSAQRGADRYAQLYLDLPRFRKQGLEKFYGDNVIQNWWKGIKATFLPRPDDPNSGYNLPDNVKLAAADLFDNGQERMPVNGIYHMDIDEVSPDVMHGIARYFYGLERQKKLREIHPIASALQDTLGHKDNQPKQMDRINKMNWRNFNIIKPLGKKGDYIRKKAIDHLIDREFFGENQAGLFSDNKQVQSIVNLMFKGASMSYLAVQLPSAVTNMLAQSIQNVIEGFGGEHFNMKDLALASKDAADAVAIMAAEIYKVGGHSATVQLIEAFDAIPGRTFEQGGKFGTQASRTLLKDIVSMSWLYSPRKFMENYATLQAFYAMMRSITIPQTINGQTTQIAYKDAFIVKDGKLTLKPGIDKTYDIGGEEFTLQKNRMKMIQYAMNGVYDKLGQGDSQRYLVFRMFSFLRRYFVTMLTNRWGITRHNPGMMDVKTGFYVEAWKAFYRGMVSKGKYFQNLSRAEKSAFKKVFAEVGIVMLTELAMSAFFGWDPDDDDKYEKLRARSGPLPILGVAETDYPFQWGGWLSNHTMLQLMKVESQTQMWVPLPNWGLSDYTGMASMESAAVGPTIDLYQKIVGDVVNYVQGNDAAYYQHGVGPYEWQQKENLKLWNHILSIYGLRGATVEPVEAIKKEQLIRTRR